MESSGEHKEAQRCGKSHRKHGIKSSFFLNVMSKVSVYSVVENVMLIESTGAALAWLFSIYVSCMCLYPQEHLLIGLQA